MADYQRMIELRRDGLTYREIGEMFGVSKQYVHQIIGRKRRADAQVEKIIYKGIHDYFVENPDISFEAFLREISGNHSQNFTRSFRRMLCDNTSDKVTMFMIRQIKKMTEITGKSFEELFERRELND